MITKKEAQEAVWNKEYVDKNGDVINNGDFVKYDNGDIKEVYLTEEGNLGIDATNPIWIENGRAVPCEYGIYPFESDDLLSVTVIPRAEYMEMSNEDTR